MYEAKSGRADHIYLARARIENGVVVDWLDGDAPVMEEPEA
jgi:hypothetical protein